MHRLSKKYSKGFILLEALLSVVILSVSIVLIVQAITASLRATVYSTQYVEAINEIDNEMSQILESSFHAGTLENREGEFENYSKRYHYALTVSESTDDADSILQQAKLAVTWHAGQKNNTIDVETFIFKNTSTEGSFQGLSDD